MTPPFVDDALRFTWLTLDDVERLVPMLARPEVCAHVYYGPNPAEVTRAYFRPQVEAMHDALDRGEVPAEHLFSIWERERGEWVGECALVPVPFGAGNYTLGYQIDAPFWRRGHGTRACRFLIWYAFAVLGAHRLSGDTLASNIGSIKVMERCGLRREGTQRGYYNARGALHDNALFGLLRDELGDGLAALDAVYAREAAEPPA